MRTMQLLKRLVSLFTLPRYTEAESNYRRFVRSSVVHVGQEWYGGAE